MKLTAESFFKYFIWRPCSNHLTPTDQMRAKVASIGLGLLTLGLSHLISHLFLFDKNFVKLDNDNLSQTDRSISETTNSFFRSLLGKPPTKADILATIEKRKASDLGPFWEHIDKKWLADRDIVGKVVEKAEPSDFGKFLAKIDPRWLADEIIILKAVEKYAPTLKVASASCQKNHSIVLAAAKSNWGSKCVIEFCAPEFREDEEIVSYSIQAGGDVNLIGENLRKNLLSMPRLIEVNSDAYGVGSPEVQADPACQKAYLRAKRGQWPMVMSHVHVLFRQRQSPESESADFIFLDKAVQNLQELEKNNPQLFAENIPICNITTKILNNANSPQIIMGFAKDADVSMQQLTESYRQLFATFNPQQNGDHKQAAEAVFICLNEAKDILLDRAYLAEAKK